MIKNNQNDVARGFTLMEVMVALFILSIISTVAVSGLNAILRAQSQQVRVAHQLEAFQMTYAWLSQDLGAHVDRNVRNTVGEVLPSIIFNRDPALTQIGIPGVVFLALTRGGITAPENLSSLQRVAYSLQGDKLMRYTWPVLDAVSSTKPKAEEILTDVALIEPRYLTDQGIYLNNWQDYTGSAKLPLAVEWKITDSNRQSVTWIFPIIGGGNSEQAQAETSNPTDETTTK
jgi:general secretion pathway protein J